MSLSWPWVESYLLSWGTLLRLAGEAKPPRAEFRIAKKAFGGELEISIVGATVLFVSSSAWIASQVPEGVM